MLCSVRPNAKYLERWLHTQNMSSAMRHRELLLSVFPHFYKMGFKIEWAWKWFYMEQTFLFIREKDAAGENTFRTACDKLHSILHDPNKIYIWEKITRVLHKLLTTTCARYKWGLSPWTCSLTAILRRKHDFLCNKVDETDLYFWLLYSGPFIWIFSCEELYFLETAYRYICSWRTR